MQIHRVEYGEEHSRGQSEKRKAVFTSKTATTMSNKTKKIDSANCFYTRKIPICANYITHFWRINCSSTKQFVCQHILCKYSNLI